MEDIILTPFCFESIIMYHKLRLQGYNVISFFDRNIYLQGKIYKSIDGDCRVEYPWRCFSSKVIICKNEYKDEIMEQMLSFGYSNSNICFVNDFNFEMSNINIWRRVNVDSLYDIWGYSDGQKIINLKKHIRLANIIKENRQEQFWGQRREEYYIDNDGIHFIFYRLEIDLTSRCTLKCKKCCNMMQYYQNPKDINVETKKNDYSRMMEIIDWTDDIMLIGGEPFLYGQLREIVEYIFHEKNTSEKVGVIRIVTNGTIIPSEDIFETFSKCNVHVLISNYGHRSRNINKLIDELVKHNINYAVQDTTQWCDVEQYVDGIEEANDINFIKNKIDDCITLCRTIDSGKFYMCAHLKSLNDLQALPSEIPKCYIDIYESNVKESLLKYLKRDVHYFKACAWCNGCSKDMWDGMKISVAEQTSKPLEYVKY